MLSEYITSLVDVSFHIVASMYVRFRYSGKNPMRFAFFWRISVRFCGFRTPLTPPSYKHSERKLSWENNFEGKIGSCLWALDMVLPGSDCIVLVIWATQCIFTCYRFLRQLSKESIVTHEHRIMWRYITCKKFWMLKFQMFYFRS